MIKDTLVVIADDFTGAAEIAGIGLRFGLQVNMVTETDSFPDCDLLVIATDTRSMSEREAVTTNEVIAAKLLQAGYQNIFKKTDSALRGHIVAELKAILNNSNYKSALLIPQNPSKGRIIKEGVYYIDNSPLHTTSFAYDPEFPAVSSVITERFDEIQLLNCNEKINQEKIYVGNAISKEEIRSFINTISSEIVLAGGADLFSAYLSSKGYEEIKNLTSFAGLEDRNAIIVCGSTMQNNLSDYNYIKRKKISICQMPLNVFEGEPHQGWEELLLKEYTNTNSIVLTIGHPSRGGKEFALRLRNTIAEIVAALVNQCLPDELIIEGGATAFTILEKLQLSSFNITEEIVSGVVRMQSKDFPQLYITVKPGSYSWGDKIFS